MASYSIEPWARKYVKQYWLLSFAKNLSNKYWNELWDTASKPTLDAPKTAFKKVVQKADEATSDENSRNVKEEIIPPKEREEVQNELTLK